MKFSIIIFFFLLASCAGNNTSKKLTDPYISSGFALVFNENDFKNKIISRKLDNSKLQIGHSTLKRNSLLKITNPANNKSIELKVSKKLNYPNFFKIILSEKVADKLGLDEDIPFVDIEQRVVNESFVAKKAVTFSEEQRVSNKAPVTKVKIHNISKKNESYKNKKPNYKIMIGEFYSENSALNLKETLENKYIEKGFLEIRNRGKNKFTLTAGPYTSINTLKNHYFELNKYGFDDLDIIQND